MDDASPRIAICGAGISGLTLAGILARALRGTNARIAVFERAPRDSDQGYGLDLNEFGQEALARAGVYHRYWELSRPRSDKFALCSPRSIEPLSFSYRPPWLMEHFPGRYHARPESNREKLRDVLLEALELHGNSTVHFETAAWDIREIVGEHGSTAELLDGDGCSLGVYDLVIDAMGLHSKLRHHRGARALVASSISRCHTQAAAAAATVHDTRGVESTL
jgi:2-polyprenyl-6-methoxyphenol hydroxylase-like FAD-dependent oxidoreductase